MSYQLLNCFSIEGNNANYRNYYMHKLFQSVLPNLQDQLFYRTIKESIKNIEICPNQKLSVIETNSIKRILQFSILSRRKQNFEYHVSRSTENNIALKTELFFLKNKIFFCRKEYLTDDIEQKNKIVEKEILHYAPSNFSYRTQYLIDDHYNSILVEDDFVFAINFFNMSTIINHFNE